MSIGIYKLNFKDTDKVYIGQCSTNIENTRYKQHLNKFKKGTASKKLQEAYNTYGIPIIEVICECGIEELNELENLAIELWDSVDRGFNTLSESGHKPDLQGEKDGGSKYSNEQVIQVFKLLIDTTKEITFKEIENITKVSLSAIRLISSSNNHKWLETEFPEEYKILRSLRGKRSYSRSAKNRGTEYPLIKSPLGKVFKIENLRSFSKENNLDESGLCHLLKGRRKSHKGWVLEI